MSRFPFTIARVIAVAATVAVVVGTYRINPLLGLVLFVARRPGIRGLLAPRLRRKRDQHDSGLPGTPGRMGGPGPGGPLDRQLARRRWLFFDPATHGLRRTSTATSIGTPGQYQSRSTATTWPMWRPRGTWDRTDRQPAGPPQHAHRALLASGDLGAGGLRRPIGAPAAGPGGDLVRDPRRGDAHGRAAGGTRDRPRRAGPGRRSGDGRERRR